MKILLLFVFIVFIYNVNCILFPIAVRLPLNGTPPDMGGSLWPKPNFQEFKNEQFYIYKRNFSLVLCPELNNCERDIIEKLWSHYQNVFFTPKLPNESPNNAENILKTVSFRIKPENKKSKFKLSECEDKYYPFIQDTETESYELNVDENKANIIASSIWGLVRGLETFSQLVYTPLNSNKLAVNKTKIIDKPRYFHRGIMLDSARHFIPLNLLKKHIDIMMYNKMNVFHWHLVDDQSFPFESKVYPDLHKKGAFSPIHVYTQSEIKELIEFARIRGIRVIPELDTPGHTYSWGLGYPDLITICWKDGKPFQEIYNFHGKREILNPIQNFTYEFVGELIKELKNVFKDPFIHLGMDEVYYRCWESNPNITEFMKSNNMNSTKDLEQYYMSRVLSAANSLGYKVTVWQDVWDNNVKVFNNTILQIWKSDKDWREYLQKATKDGYQVILSSPWYLNYIKYGSDWYDFYKIEPTDFTGTEAQKKLIIGGEACMWSEFVDGANSISRLWPRASAIAERLWSTMDLNDVEEAKFRLDDHRCRMLKRGIEAGPIFNSYCGNYEPYMSKSLINEPVFNYIESTQQINSANKNQIFLLFNFILIFIFFKV
ncbi:unnamed protein product [Brachionus calyciflorus]|uniref:Beta-hexosaminidase n=1 Tax=Brachionus calyciflorus TaxID=104777 RepID=A0A814AFQ3_9BILA|nr:unnamed protein product [Brachionus calyciflorus]